MHTVSCMMGSEWVYKPSSWMLCEAGSNCDQAQADTPSTHAHKHTQWDDSKSYQQKETPHRHQVTAAALPGGFHTFIEQNLHFCWFFSLYKDWKKKSPVCPVTVQGVACFLLCNFFFDTVTVKTNKKQPPWISSHAETNQTLCVISKYTNKSKMGGKSILL